MVVLDAINEAPNLSAFADMLGATLHRAKHAPVRFVLTCRRSDWRFFRHDSRITDSLWTQTTQTQLPNSEGVSLDRFNSDELNVAWPLYQRYFGITGVLEEAAREICAHPIMMRFVCEAFRGRSLPPFLDTVDVFNQYWDAKVESNLHPHRAANLFALVTRLREVNATAILEQDAVQIISADAYNALLSEDIILYIHTDRFTQVRLVGFMYEAFFEYCIARSILWRERWDLFNASQLLTGLQTLMAEANQNRTMVGVVEFVLLHFQDHSTFDDMLDLLDCSADWKQRCCALLPRLRKFDEHFSHKLSRLIKDTDYWVRWATSFCAAQLPNDKVFDHMIDDWFADLNPLVREGAANALVHRPTHSVRWRQIVELSNDASWRVRRALAECINRGLSQATIKFAQLEDLVRDASWRRRDVAVVSQRHLQVNPDASQRVFRMVMSDSNERVRFEVAKFVGTMQQASTFVPLLAELARDPSIWVRRRVARSILCLFRESSG